jgi:thiol-disulfide isomerase/thioredoxin
MATNDPAKPARRGPAAAVVVAVLAGLVGDAAMATAAGVPENVALTPLKGPDGRTVELAAPKTGAAVIVFYSPECPISNAYGPTLNRLASEAPAGRVRFVGVCVDPDLTDAEVLAHLKDFGLTFPVVADRRGDLARKLGATITPEAFLIDDAGRVRYHGRIDDQFVARRKANANPETHELADALADVLAGRKVKVAHVAAVGCPLPVPPPDDRPKKPGS